MSIKKLRDIRVTLRIVVGKILNLFFSVTVGNNRYQQIIRELHVKENSN